MTFTPQHVIDLGSEHLSFVTKISTVMKATADDDKPMPGYLFKEINDISLEGPGTCESLLLFLVDRLGKPSCHVKLKVLKLMNHVVQNGHPNFAAGLRKMSQGIHLATNFGGPPDPLHGNVPFALVRKAANDLCSVLFDVKSSSNSDAAPITAALQGRIVGMGASQPLSRMAGFGNSPGSYPKSLGDTILDGLEKLAEQLNQTPADQQRAVLASFESTSGSYQPPKITSCDNHTSSLSPAIPLTKPALPHHVPGKAGGGWDDPEPLSIVRRKRDLTDGSGGDLNVSDLSNRLGSEMDGNWGVEEEAVRQITEESLGPLLQPSLVIAFRKSCSAYNCEHIVQILIRNLASDKEPIVMKTMLLIEMFMRSDLVNFSYLKSACLQPLIKVYHKWEGAPTQKAGKIIRIWERWAGGQCGMYLPVPQDKQDSSLNSNVSETVGVGT